tara:strand:+ start:67 stop:549 length:483 start_codon:yes stop_codon:yes gene_type:complete
MKSKKLLDAMKFMKKFIIFVGITLWCGNAFTKSKLPILECSINNPNGSKTTQIYDLSEIERLDPTNNFKPGSDDYKIFKKKDGESTTLNIFENEYRIQYRNTFSGQTAGYMATINRKSGELNATILKKRSVDLSFSELLEVIADAPKYTGVCNISKNKNL